MKRMETVRAAYFLLPGHELDGYPRYLESEPARSFLAGWLALWEPRLLASCDGAPYWHSAEHPPERLENCVVVIPPFSQSYVDADWLRRAESEDVAALVFHPEPQDWQVCQAMLLERLKRRLADAGSAPSAPGDPSSSEPLPTAPPETSQTAASSPSHSALPVDWHCTVPDELRDEFAALGYAFLQIELMTRQLRYTSNLDRPLFDEQTAQAARAALEGNAEQARHWLQSCFDALGQERDHYYSLDVNIVDITLLAPTTLNNSLRHQLQREEKTSLLASADLLGQLEETAPDNMQKLRERCGKGDRLTVCGGLACERPHPLMTADALLRDLIRGHHAYRRQELPPPQVFARYSFGLTSDAIAEIARVGMQGALLIAWADGDYPTGSQSKILWESSDGTYLATVATEPLDASDPSSFLSFGWRIGEALDHEHVPTVCFAHWPNRVDAVFTLLQIVARYTPALGVWHTVDEYFAQTDQPYHQERLSPYAFRYEWIARHAHPQQLLHGVARYHQLHVRIRSVQNLLNLASLASNRPQGGADDDTSSEATALDMAPSLRQRVDPLWERLDRLFDDEPSWSAQADALSQDIEALAQEVLADLSEHVIAREPDPRGVLHQGGELLLNPRSCPLRIRTRTAADEVFAAESWRASHGMVGQHRYTNIDVPGLGFVCAPLIADGGTKNQSSSGHHQVLADETGALRNEFLEAQIDAHRGHLRSVYIPERRGNRLSAMIARRRIDDKGQWHHSQMVADSVELRTSSTMAGLIRATGRLLSNGTTWGEFEIDYEIWRGSRVLEIVVRLSVPKHESGAYHPWRDAYVLRLAWATEAAIVRSFQCGRRHSWPHGKCISPLLIEIDEAEHRTHLLTGGLAFHRREGTRGLETLLSVDQGRCEHRIGIGIDLPQPMQAAHDFVDHRYAHTLTADQAVKPAAAWLASVDAKNVMLDLEAPLVDRQGRLRGQRLLLTETQGRSTTAKVRLPYPVSRACRVNAWGKQLTRLTTLDDGFLIPLRANERCLVDVMWGH
ncbi:MAG: hypothetical protein KatS3mg111_1448 [Pirellulaceae bacterium]|nr:MAG: hypothetical protein KatS3mg111_1448 [Pirellulaceae bacterium]